MRFQAKADLITAIESEHATFLARVESLARGDRTRPGVWGDGWTVKDLLAHLTEWEQMFLGWHRAGLAGRRPALPAEGYKWNETPRLNQAIWRKHRRRSWTRVREDFDRSYEEILGVARGLPERDLLEPGRFTWTGKLPLATYLAANTSSHYRTASKFLKRWLRRVE